MLSTRLYIRKHTCRGSDNIRRNVPSPKKPVPQSATQAANRLFFILARHKTPVMRTAASTFPVPTKVVALPRLGGLHHRYEIAA